LSSIATIERLERLERDHKQAIEQLTVVQTRCSELLTENRALKMAAATLVEPAEWKRTFEKALATLQRKT
jgi:FtsZ-binding cell division protein ZapB